MGFCPFLKLRAYHLTTNLTTKPSASTEAYEGLWNGRRSDDGLVVEIQGGSESYGYFAQKIPTMKPID